jgi:hypothetical protein
MHCQRKENHPQHDLAWLLAARLEDETLTRLLAKFETVEKALERQAKIIRALKRQDPRSPNLTEWSADLSAELWPEVGDGITG